MEISKKLLPKSQVELSISLSKEEMLSYIDKATKDLAKKVTIPGFRKGEAPQKMVEKHLGSGYIFEEALEKAVGDSYKKAIEQEKLIPLEQAKVDLDEKQDGEKISYKAVVSIMPELNLPDYKKIAKSIKPENFKVLKKDLEEAKKYLLKSRGTLKSVERESKKDDTVTISYTLNLGDKEIDKSESMLVEIGGGQFIKGFEDNIIGLKVSDNKSFELEFPANYHNKEISCKKGRFDIEIKKIEESIFPDWDDKFADSSTQGKHKTIQELEKSLEEGIFAEKESEVKTKHTQDIMDLIMKEVKIDLPAVLVDFELERLISEMEQRSMYSGESLEKALERSGKTMDELKKDSTPQAESRVILMLILRKIAELEKIYASEEEITSQVNSILSRYSKEKIEKMDLEKLKVMVEGEILDKMTLNYLSNLHSEEKLDKIKKSTKSKEDK